MPDEEPKPNTEEPKPQSPPAEEMVPRSQFQEAVQGRQTAKEKLNALSAQHNALIEANDGNPLTVEDIKAFREAQKAAQKAEEEAAKKRGDFEELIQKKDSDHAAALKDRDDRYDTLYGSYRTEKLGSLISEHLAKSGVLPDAVETAREHLLQFGDPKQQVRMEFAQDPDTKKWLCFLKNQAGTTAMDSETGKALELETFFKRHKKNHGYLYRREVAPGSGEIGDATAPGDAKTLQEQVSKAVETMDHDEFRKHRKALFGLS